MNTGNNYQRSEFFLKILFYLLIVFAVAVTLYGINILIIPIILAVLIYYLLNNFVNYLESFGIRRIYPIISFFVFFSLIIYLVISSFLPVVMNNLYPLLSDWTNQLDEKSYKFLNLNINIQINDMSYKWDEVIQPQEIISKVMGVLKNTISDIVSFLPSLITILLITPIIAFFLLMSGNDMYKGFIDIIPNRYFEMTLVITDRISNQITGYLKGLVIQAAIMTAVTSSGYAVLGLPFALAFGITSGLANSIPYAGPLIGAVPPLIYCIINPAWSSSIYTVIGIVLVAQLVDNFIVQPMVIAQSVSIHPMMLIGAVIVAGNLFGIIGMLVAVPLVSILKVALIVLHRSLREYKII